MHLPAFDPAAHLAVKCILSLFAHCLPVCPTLADCRNEDRVDVIEVGGDGVHYYEGDDYLIIGVKFSGSSTRSGTLVPLFNGRFTGRMETQLLGEVNARMEMETPDTLIRYAIKDGGEVDSKPVNIWVRCPKAPRVK